MQAAFYPQGDYGLFQCSGSCRQETFKNEEAVRKMMECQKDMRILLELGVGYHTPGIIKYPFWQMAAVNPKATYDCDIIE